MRVALDTNILISAFIFPGGPPEAVYRLALEERIELATSPPLLAEFGRILTAKFGWDPTLADDAVAGVARIGYIVRPSERMNEITADPDDDRVLEAATEAGADFIVSGDRHLLKLDTWRGIRVLKAADFLADMGHGV